MKKIYRGYITDKAVDGEGEDLLGIIPDADDTREVIVLAKQVQEDMMAHGHFLSVCFYVSDKPQTKDEAIRALFVPYVSDDGDEVEFDHAYSEYTGYLWTDETLVVGGHDLIVELSSHAGKFIHLEITYDKQPPPGMDRRDI